MLDKPGAPYVSDMTDFNEVKESVSDLLLLMVELADERKWPLVRQASLEIERSRIGGIVEFPGLEIKSRGLRGLSPKKELQLKKELHELVSPLTTSAKDIGLPPIYGAKITVTRGGPVTGRLIFGEDLTAEQQEMGDKLLEDWNQDESALDCPTPHIEQVAGSEVITERSNELLDFLLDIARKRKRAFKKVVYIGAKRFVTPKGDPVVMLYGWNIRTGKDSDSESLRAEVERKMGNLNEVLEKAGLPEVGYAEMNFWPPYQISPELVFPYGASSEEKAVLKDLKRCWFKHLQVLHETDGEYCPGCGKTKCRN